MQVEKGRCRNHLMGCYIPMPTCIHALPAAQIGDTRAAESALSSSRTCVSSFPTRIEDGLLFAWLDSSPGAAAEAKAAEKTMVSHHVAGDAAISPTWISNTVTNDYIFWQVPARLHGFCATAILEPSCIQLAAVKVELPLQLAVRHASASLVDDSVNFVSLICTAHSMRKAVRY